MFYAGPVRLGPYIHRALPPAGVIPLILPSFPRYAPRAIAPDGADFSPSYAVPNFYPAPSGYVAAPSVAAAVVPLLYDADAIATATAGAVVAAVPDVTSPSSARPRGLAVFPAAIPAAVPLARAGALPIAMAPAARMALARRAGAWAAIFPSISISHVASHAVLNIPELRTTVPARVTYGVANTPEMIAAARPPVVGAIAPPAAALREAAADVVIDHILPMPPEAAAAVDLVALLKRSSPAQRDAIGATLGIEDDTNRWLTEPTAASVDFLKVVDIAGVPVLNPSAVDQIPLLADFVKGSVAPGGPEWAHAEVLDAILLAQDLRTVVGGWETDTYEVDIRVALSDPLGYVLTPGSERMDSLEVAVVLRRLPQASADIIDDFAETPRACPTGPVPSPISDTVPYLGAVSALVSDVEGGSLYVAHHRVSADGVTAVRVPRMRLGCYVADTRLEFSEGVHAGATVRRFSAWARTQVHVIPRALSPEQRWRLYQVRHGYPHARWTLAVAYAVSLSYSISPFQYTFALLPLLALTGPFFMADRRSIFLLLPFTPAEDHMMSPHVSLAALFVVTIVLVAVVNAVAERQTVRGFCGRHGVDLFPSWVLSCVVGFGPALVYLSIRPLTSSDTYSVVMGAVILAVAVGANVAALALLGYAMVTTDARCGDPSEGRPPAAPRARDDAMSDPLAFGFVWAQEYTGRGAWLIGAGLVRYALAPTVAVRYVGVRAGHWAALQRRVQATDPHCDDLARAIAVSQALAFVPTGVTAAGSDALARVGVLFRPYLPSAWWQVAIHRVAILVAAAALGWPGAPWQVSYGVALGASVLQLVLSAGALPGRVTNIPIVASVAACVVAYVVLFLAAVAMPFDPWTRYPKDYYVVTVAIFVITCAAYVAVVVAYFTEWGARIRRAKWRDLEPPAAIAIVPPRSINNILDADGGCARVAILLAARSLLTGVVPAAVDDPMEETVALLCGVFGETIGREPTRGEEEAVAELVSGWRAGGQLPQVGEWAPAFDPIVQTMRARAVMTTCLPPTEDGAHIMDDDEHVPDGDVALPDAYGRTTGAGYVLGDLPPIAEDEASTHTGALSVMSGLAGSTMVQSLGSYAGSHAGSAVRPGGGFSGATTSVPTKGWSGNLRKQAHLADVGMVSPDAYRAPTTVAFADPEAVMMADSPTVGSTHAREAAAARAAAVDTLAAHGTVALSRVPGFRGRAPPTGKWANDDVALPPAPTAGSRVSDDDNSPEEPPLWARRGGGAGPVVTL